MVTYSTVVYFLWIISIFGCVSSDEWLDPLDPINYDPLKIERDYQKYKNSKTQQHLKSEKLIEKDESDTEQDKECIECSCMAEKKQIEELSDIIDRQPSCEIEFFKPFVARLVLKLKQALKADSSGVYNFQFDVSLTNNDLETLDNFKKMPDKIQFADVHHIITSMIKRIQQVDISEDFSIDFKSWIQCISSCVAAIALLLIAIFAQWHSRMPWTKIIGSLFVLMFIISVPWNWWHLYQEEMASQIAKSHLSLPAECTPESMPFFQYLMSGFSIRDKCKDYYRNVFVDPWTEVPPTKAVAVTVTKFVLEPLEYIGEALGKMIKASLMDLPPQLWPVALGFVILIFVMILVMSFGYRIKLFYLFGLEPSQPAVQATDKQVLKQIQSLEQHSQKVENMLRAMEEQLGGVQPQIVPSIREHSHNILDLRYSPSDSHLAVPEYRLQQSVHMPTSVSMCSLRGTQSHHDQPSEDSHVEDVDIPEPLDQSRSVASGVDASKILNINKGKKKKKQAVKDLADSSVAIQCGHTREEDKLSKKSNQPTVNDQTSESEEPELDRAETGKDVSSVTNVNTASASKETPAALISGFDPLAKVIGKTTPSSASSSQVEEVTSQDAMRSGLRPSESSEDSELEIIEEEPENM